MANLNFQQPPRSIPNQSLSRNAFNSSSLSGHVTPTSAMFPGGASTTSSFSPQQLSPNRNLPPMANRNLFSQQRAFSERRLPTGNVMQDWSSSSMGSMGIVGQGSRSSSSYSSHNNSLQSMFNNTNSSSTVGGGDVSNSPSLLDLSEFPSLTSSRGHSDSIPQSNTSSIPGKQPYVGMVKAPVTEPSEFTMSSEDFPALPGTQSTSISNSASGSSSSMVNSEKLVNHESNSQSVEHESSSSRLGITSAAPGAEKHQLHQNQQHMQFIQQHMQQLQLQHPNQTGSSKQKGVQTFPDGRVYNVPKSMMKDQFGMIGLLSFIRVTETDKTISCLALGQDLTVLGLNLNAPGNLHPTFAGPWASAPYRPHDMEFNVPPEYIIFQTVKNRLPEVKLHRYHDDLLFYFFYMFAGDTLQMAASVELYNRDWRFHTEEKIWISYTSALNVVEKHANYERGVYLYFDAPSWRKVAREFCLEYNKLECRPSPAQQQMNTLCNASSNISISGSSNSSSLVSGSVNNSNNVVNKSNSNSNIGNDNDENKSNSSIIGSSNSIISINSSSNNSSGGNHNNGNSNSNSNNSNSNNNNNVI